MSRLTELGWTEALAAHCPPDSAGRVPARVVAEHRSRYDLVTEAGDRPGQLAGRFRHDALAAGDWPAVGDWVLVDADPTIPIPRIHAVLPRRSRFSRKQAGDRTAEQVVAANIDSVWILAALDAPWNPRGLERYLTLAWESGAQPVVILSKADLAADPDAVIRDTERVAIGAPVHAVSALTGAGLEALEPYLVPASTIALLGPSGSGKSTLINRLLGAEAMRTGAVRASDHRGRHTTTHRQLLRLPGGALVVDTPGMRELQLWDADDGLQETFADVDALAGSCRFADCRHEQEPGCAVQAAVATGTLDPGRLQSWRKLQAELAYQERRGDPAAEAELKRRWKAIMKEYRKHPKNR